MNGIMKGTGTIDDPYVIQDAYDLCAIKNNDDGFDTYYTLERNIDFNNHEAYKYGLDKGQFIAKKGVADKVYIDGCGKEIRNIVFMNRGFDSSGAGDRIEKSSLIEVASITNTMFVNVTSISSFGALSWLSASVNEHNSFNILAITPDDTNHLIPLNMVECTFNLTCREYSDSLNFGGKKIERTHINLDFVNKKNQYFFSAVNLDTCLVTGSYDSQQTTRSPYVFSSGKVNNSVFALDISCSALGENIEIGSNSTTFTGINLFDKDTTQIHTSSSTNYKVLSTAKMKNTSYLQSIGFPVVSG